MSSMCEVVNIKCTIGLNWNCRKLTKYI